MRVVVLMEEAAMLRRIAIGLVVMLLSSGCTAIKAYEGPERSKSEIAVLQAGYSHGGVLAILVILPHPHFKHVTEVYEIDGQTNRLGGLGAAEIHIRPGEHTAWVRYMRYPDVTLCGGLGGCIPSYEARNISIDFTAVAGHEYRIPAERIDERNWVWVEDVTTGKVVAGEKPPEPAAPPK